MDFKKKQLLEQIMFWDSNEAVRGLSSGKKQLRDLAKQDFARTICLEEIKWKKKAKVKWPIEGDNNTIFLHGIASLRRNTDFIHPLVDDNGCEIAPDCLKSHIAAYFMKLYKDPGIRRPKLNGVQFKRISSNNEDLDGASF